MKLVWTFGLVLAATLSWLACSSPRPDRTAVEGRRPLRVGVYPYLTFAPLHLAAAEGDFQRRGIEVEFVQLAQSSEPTPLLVSGRLDVLPSPVSPAILNAIHRAAPIRFVSGKGFVDPASCINTALVYRGSLTGTGASDALPPEIRRVAHSRTSFFRFFEERALAQGRIDPSTVERVYLSPAEEIDALRRGAVDAASVSEPWLTHAARQGEVVIWAGLKDLIPGHQISVISFGEVLLHEDPALGEDFIAAYLDGVRRYHEGKTPRNLEILAEVTGFEPELLSEMCWPRFREDGRIDFDSIMRYQAWLLKRGLIDALVPSGEFWDPRFTERAVRAGSG